MGAHSVYYVANKANFSSDFTLNNKKKRPSVYMYLYRFFFFIFVKQKTHAKSSFAFWFCSIIVCYRASYDMQKLTKTWSDQSKKKNYKEQYSRNFRAVKALSSPVNNKVIIIHPFYIYLNCL